MGWSVVFWRRENHDKTQREVMCMHLGAVWGLFTLSRLRRGAVPFLSKVRPLHGQAPGFVALKLLTSLDAINHGRLDNFVRSRSFPNQLISNFRQHFTRFSTSSISQDTESEMLVVHLSQD